MLKKFFTLSAAMAIFFVAKSQDSTKGTTTITGSVDAYYRYDFNNQAGNNKTSFTNSANSFELGMASIKFDHTVGKVAATADLGFGRRAEEFSYNDGTGWSQGIGNKYNTLAAIKQAYLSYAVSSKLKITAGKWATHVGWELVDAYANRNYSMSYAFTNGPFFHTGAKADIALGGKTSLMVGVANPTDYSTHSSGNFMAIAQLSSATKNDKLKAYLNYQGGSTTGTAQLNQFDLVLNYVPSAKFSVVYNGTYQIYKDSSNGNSKNWSSNVLYFNYDPISKFGLTLRGEYFDDKDGIKLYTSVPTTPVTTLPVKSLMAITLSGNIRLANLTIIPEFRYDSGKEDVGYFTKNDGASTKSATSFILAATYKF